MRIRATWLSALALMGLAGWGLPGCGSSGGTGVPPPTHADLASLALSTGTLAPAFSPAVTTYSVGPGLLNATVEVTATPAVAGASLTVNAVPTTPGSPSAPIALSLGPTPVAVTVTAADGTSRTYTIVLIRVGPAGQEAFLKASNTDINDQFGVSVAISGDTLVVGAFPEASNATGVNAGAAAQADDSAPNAGAAYIFVRAGATWTQQAYLKASNTDAGDWFGWSVAISGDTVVVGALLEDSIATGVNAGAAAQADDSASAAGAAYVFVRSGTTWTQQAYLKASNTDAGDSFGGSVAISGETVVVGATLEASTAMGVNPGTVAEADDGTLHAGAAYVFVRNGTTWTQQAYLKASNTDAEDQFGFSVTISGDTVVATAPGEASSATGVNGNAAAQADDTAGFAGAAYVFVRTGTTWSQQAYLKASNTDALDTFGYSAAISGDTLVVGALGEDGNGTGVNPGPIAEADDSAVDAGAAYVFVRNGATWTQQAYLKASNTEAGDGLGIFVSISGDALVVGGYTEDSNASGVNPGAGAEANDSFSNSGAAYVFVGTGTAWIQHAYLKASNSDSSDRFGRCVGISGDTVVVSANAEASNATGVNPGAAAEADDSANASGAVYIFR